VICARRADVLESAADDIGLSTGGGVLLVQADVIEPLQIEDLLARTIAQYGRLDILVNNAGTSAGGPFGSATDDYWQADLDLKLFAAIRCSRLAIPHMRTAGGGRIINVTAAGGKSPEAASVPTSVSRAAGIALTKAMSKKYAPDNILVNTACMGLLKSGQHDRLWQQARERDPGLTRDEFYAEWGKSVPLGRIGEAEKEGDLIAFLVSDRAGYITGAAINIDGGMSAVV
jgi:NAD(P)-dependent dehydrogenase (short-subunit alcohol dehydrogenase family)